MVQKTDPHALAPTGQRAVDAGALAPGGVELDLARAPRCVDCRGARSCELVPANASPAPSRMEPAAAPLRPPLACPKGTDGVRNAASPSTQNAESAPEQTRAEDSEIFQSLLGSTWILSREEKAAFTPSSGHFQTTSVRSLCGQTIADRYFIREKLGEGAQAKVYRAHDLELDEEIALKVLSRDQSNDTRAEEQFKQEIRLLRRIVHPNVCRAYDLGRWGDLLYVTMELIDGQTLSELIRNDVSADLDTRLSIFRDILLGLRAAHALGIVHGDIKPQNVIVTPEGRAVIMDFGLAREEGSGRHRSDALCGTPAYIAPECLRGMPADQRSDIYSLGVVLFELTTGRMPFTGGNISEVFCKHIDGVPPSIRQIDAELPRSIESAVMQMLEKAPDKRYGSVDQVLEVLAQIRSTPVGKTVLPAEEAGAALADADHQLVGRGPVPPVADRDRKREARQQRWSPQGSPEHHCARPSTAQLPRQAA